MRMLSLIVLAALAMAPATALALEDSEVLIDGEAFLERKAEIERDLDEGVRYEHLDPGDERRIRSALNRLAARLEGVETIEDIPRNLRAKVFNDQEMINTLLGEVDAFRQMVCKRESAAGTHFKQTTCKTEAEWAQLQEASQESRRRMGRLQPSLGVGGGGGGPGGG